MTGAVARSRPLSKPLKALLVGLISALAALSCLEIAVRMLGLDTPAEDTLRHHPRFGWTQNPDNPRRDGVAEDGFRHPPLTREKPPGVRRVVILGDSFSQGTAYDYPATFAGLLGEWLERGTGERWQVINLGVSGWGTGQQYLALRDVGMAFEPDVVVLQSLPFNDLCNNSIDLAHVCDSEDSYRPYFVLDDGELKRTWDEPWRARLRRSALYRLLERRLPALAPPAPEPAPTPMARKRALMEFHRSHSEAAGLEFRAGLYTLLPDEYHPPAIQRAWAVTERLLDEIAVLTLDAGVPLVGVVVPFGDTLDPVWLERNSQPGGWPRPREGAPLDPVIGTGRMERLLAERGAAVIPMRELVTAGPMEPRDFFYPFGKSGDRHLNRYGHFRFAGWLVDELRRLGLTTARPPAPRIDRADLLARDTGYPVAVRNLLRTQDYGGGPHRLARGPFSQIAFESEAAVPMRLWLGAEKRGKTEAIAVTSNGAEIGVLELGGDGAFETELAFTAEPGRNEIRLVYRGWKRGGDGVAAKVTRLALARD